MVNLSKLSVFSLVFIVGWLISSYQMSLIETQYFVEPAENEALVLSQSISFTSGSQEIGTYISEGVLPIYPDLFHKFSLLADNKLASLRSISVFSFWVTSVGLFFYACLITRSTVIAALLALLFYGTASHSLYFMMARPDGLYIGLGSLSLVIYGALVHFQPKKEYLTFLGMAAVGLLSGLSLLSKQSGLFFFVIVIFTLLSGIWFKRNRLNSLNSLGYFLGSYFITVALYFYYSPVSLEFFLNGLTLYASDFSLSHVYNQLVDLFVYYWWLILGSLLFLVDLLRKKRFDETLFWLGIWSITLAVSIKLFSNNAAHFNNYIFFTVTFFFMVTSLWTEFRFKRSCHIILFLGALVSFFSFTPGANQSKFQSVHESYKSRIILNGSLENSAIFNYLKSTSGAYLTGRTDFMLYFSDKNISYEGSVFDAYYNQGRKSENSTVTKLLAKKRIDINDKIETQFFSGIILGINDETIKNFPIIKEKYMQLETQNIESGDWPHTISLWVPVGK